MSSFFAPAIILMNRLSYAWKFILLEAMLLLVIVLLAGGLFFTLDREKQAAQNELDGLRLIGPISRVVQLMQEHRGLSSAMLGGGVSMRERFLFVSRETDDATRELDRMLPPELASRADWKDFSLRWKNLHAAGPSGTVEENFSRHTGLINELLEFETVVADKNALTLDPEFGSYYLIDTIIKKLPDALEHFGQVQAKGTGILARKHITERQKLELYGIISKLEDALVGLKASLDKTGSQTALQSMSAATFSDVGDSARRIIELVEGDIIGEHFNTPSEDFFDECSAAMNGDYAKIYEVLLPATEKLLRKRIDEADNMLYFATGSALLLFAITVYFSVGIIRSIVGNTRALARSAHALAGGDLEQRIRLDTHDELRQIGESFNEMAEGFGAMLKARHADELRLRATLDTALDAVVTMDSVGGITDWNRQAQNVFGWTREEAVGRLMHETIIPPRYREAHQHGLEKFKQTGKGNVLNTRIEITALHRDGHEFPVELAITPVEQDGELWFNSFIRDITERKRAEAELLRTNGDLTRFAEVSAHHLMEPIRRLSIYSQRLRTRLEVMPEERYDWEMDESVSTMEHDAAYLRNLVRDIQLYLAAGVPRGEVQRQDANAVLEMLKERLAPKLAELGASMEISSLPDVELDRPRLADLFLVLLENALQHGRPGDPAVPLHIRVGGERDGAVTRYFISDNGQGIPSQYLERVFEIFERLAPRGEEGGSGIGLAIARRIVESRGGKIQLKNQSQGGAMVMLELPDGE